MLTGTLIHLDIGSFDQFSVTDYYFILSGAYGIVFFFFFENYYHEVIFQRPSPLLKSIRNLYAFLISNDGMGYKASICMFNNRLQHCSTVVGGYLSMCTIHSNDRLEFLSTVLI